jgi:hypothetical protein
MRGCRVCAALRRAAIDIAAEHGISEVSVSALAEQADLRPIDVMRHTRGSVTRCVESAYVDAACRLQREFMTSMGTTGSWCEGLRTATEQLVETLVGDPAAARFCYVEILEGDGRLVELREQMRASTVALLTQEYRARCGETIVSAVHIELVCGALIHAIADHARDRRTDDLPEIVESILSLSEPCEPQPRV